MDGTSRGRLFGKNVLEAVFRASPDEDLFLGELLVGVDPERRRRYLFRITDVAYGSESSDEGWAERTAGGLMSMDEAGERTDLREAFAREGLPEDDVDLVMRDFHLTLNA